MSDICLNKTFARSCFLLSAFEGDRPHSTQSCRRENESTAILKPKAINSTASADPPFYDKNNLDNR